MGGRVPERFLMRFGCRHWRESRGSMGPMLVILTVTLFVMVGLVADGGSLLAGRREAHDVASQAALAGLAAIDTQALLDGDPIPRLDQPRAQSAAAAFISQAGVEGTVDVSRDQVRVVVRIPVSMAFLAAVGVSDRIVEGTAVARPVRGVVAGET